MSVQSDFLNLIIPLALEDEKTSKVPAEVTIGQAITESAWGKSLLSIKGNNLFGIKASKGWTGEVIHMTGFEYIKGRKVYEQMNWRKYPSLLASIQDHGRFLQASRYKAAFSTTNWLDFLKEVKKGGYATDPDYVTNIHSIINRYQIHKTCEELRRGSTPANDPAPEGPEAA